MTKLKVKKLLRFYYSADGLEKLIDGKIMKCAFGYSSCIDGAERICALIEEKSELARLWNYLDGLIKEFSEEDKSSLKRYALMRCGLKTQPPDTYKGIKRAAVKLVRHARRLYDYGRAIELVNYYYCVLGSAVGAEVTGLPAGEV